MSRDDRLAELRAEIRALEEPLLLALRARSRFLLDLPALELACAPAGSAARSRLERAYRREIVPHLCQAGDDGRHAECLEADRRLLELLRRRLRLGAEVAEAKMRRDAGRLAALVGARDRSALIEALTDEVVEEQVLERTRALAARIAGPEAASGLGQVFARWIIPLTKEAEVDSLLGEPDSV